MTIGIGGSKWVQVIKWVKKMDRILRLLWMWKIREEEVSGMPPGCLTGQLNR